MADEEVSLKVDIDVSGGAKTLGGLRSELERLNEEIEQVPIGSKAFNDLNTQIAQTGREVKNLELGFESLDNEQVASEIGSVAGAIGDVTTGLILLGGENETLKQVAENIEKAMGVSMAFKGSIEGLSSARKLLNNLDKESIIIKAKDLIVSKARAVATAVMTGAQWLLNVAMNANPIGLIIIGVTALIGIITLAIIYFDEITEAVIKFSKYLLLLLGPIGWLILAFKEMQDEEMSLEEQREIASKKEKKRYDQKKRQIIEEMKLFKKASDEKQKQLDLEIDRLDAEGKSSFALRLFKLEDIKAVKEKQLETYNELIQASIEHYKNQAKLNGLSEAEFLEQAKKQGVDLLKIQEEAEANSKKYKDAIFAAETEIIALKRQNAEKNKKVAKETNEEIINSEEDKNKELARLDEQRLKEENDRRLKAIEDYNSFLEEKENLENEYFDSQLTDQQREENAIADKYFRLLELAKQYGEDTATLEQAQQEELALSRSEFAEQQLQQKREEQQAQAELIISTAEDILSIASSIQELGNSRELKRIKAKQDAGEKLSQAEKQRLIRDEKQKRAIAVAEIAIDTARGIAGAVASGAGMPFPANIPAIISGVSAVLAGVASATKVLNEPLPSFDDPTSAVGSAQGASEQAPNINAIDNGSSLLNQPSQVYVVESDITSTQNSVNVIEQQATIG